MNTQAINRISELSPREREVLRLINEGLNTKQIAERLDISIRTVQTHLATSCRILGIRRETFSDRLRKLMA